MVPKAYMWKAGKWEYVGEALAQATGSEKRHYAGDRIFPKGEYDYVFDVDINEGAPKAKLPYNEGENPLVVAERFLTRENMNMGYKEQITDFIRKNTKGGGKALNLPKAAPQKQVNCFPLRQTVFYDQRNIDGFVKKFEEIEKSLKEAGTHMELKAHDLRYVYSLAEKLRDPTLYAHIKEFEFFEVQTAQKIIKFPGEQFAAILDFWRMIVLHHASQVFFAGLDSGLPIIAGITGKLKHGPAVLWVLYYKFLSNMWMHENNMSGVIRGRDILDEAYKQMNKHDAKLLPIFINYLMNASSCMEIAPTKNEDYVNDQIHYAAETAENQELDPESVLKLAVAVGNFHAFRPANPESKLAMQALLPRLEKMQDENAKMIVESFKRTVSEA